MRLTESSQITIGMTVYHAYFGEGKVDEYTWKDGVKVVFNQGEFNKYFAYSVYSKSSDKLQHLFTEPVEITEQCSKNE